MEISRLLKDNAAENQAALIGVDSQGEFLCTGNLFGDVQICSAVSGDRSSLRGHTKKVLSCCFSPQRDVLCTGSADSTIRFWSTSTQECMQVEADSSAHAFVCSLECDPSSVSIL
jgi:WD40 repeat protein